MTELTELTIAEAGARLLRRSTSATELLEATLAVIEETEPTVCAYVRVFADEAREQARHADRELARGLWRGPLHGIPVAVKDLCWTRDAPTEAGSRVMAGFVPPHDATVVRRLRDAGALIVGKTVTHEFAWGVNIPPTRNPWDLACYPGGSSAGSGVAVSVRSAFGAIGTDTGGSVRIPAAANLLVGLKPTFGRVSRAGIVPLSTSLDHPGPLTRTVEDCAIVLEAIAGHDREDPGSIDEPVPDYRAGLEDGVEGLVIGVEREHHFYAGVDDDIRSAVEGVIAEYEAAGATVVEVTLPEFALMATVGLTILLADASSSHRRLLRERGADYDPATRLMLELGELLPATHYVAALRARTVLRSAVRNSFRAHGLDAMLWPTMPITTVPVADLNLPRDPGTGETPMAAMVHHSFSANVLGLPAVSVPCGLSSAGLPMGFQLLGRPFDEATVLRAARAYERAHSWPSHRPEIRRHAAHG